MTDKAAHLTHTLPAELSGHTAVQIVLAYLDAMENRQLDAAKALLAPGFRMTFPGPVQLKTLDELIEWAATRYRRIAKRYDGVDVAAAVPEAAGDKPEQTVVYCFGTLYGEWLSGESFEGIRFIDRFAVADGFLVDQKVWNDLGKTANRIDALSDIDQSETVAVDKISAARSRNHDAY